jgi:hypothetical protein
LLEQVYRQPYVFDAKQSAIVGIRAGKDASHVQVNALYGLQKLTLPALTPTGVAAPTTLPQTLPDIRSLFLGYQYSLARLPEPMPARLADDRIGHFTTTRWDFGNDRMPNPRIHLVNRWRLEKRQPAAAMSEPVRPIVFWLDRNIPVQYRQAVREGVLAWNKAFERIGFSHAIEVKQQEDDADFDTADSEHASIRWYFGVDNHIAVGPSRVDPRTGEILDADIVIPDSFTRVAYRFFNEEKPAASALSEDGCGYAADAAAEMEFALDTLEARGDIAPGSVAETEFINDVVRDVVMHEVGHTLGLRHNFHASTAYTEAQLGDKVFTREHGIAASVMDYSPVNLALQGQPQGEYRMKTLGDYDYWAIEYAYRPFDAASEEQGLAAIAARSREPLLAYGTDEDAGENEDGLDPDISRFDLGSDPLAYIEKRIKLSQELWRRLQSRKMVDGESYAILRRNAEVNLGQLYVAAHLSAKFVAGVSHVRDHAGSGRLPLTPIGAETQRRALRLIVGSVFAPQSFAMPADFLQKLVPDGLDRHDHFVHVTFAFPERVQALHANLLGRLYGDDIARRLIEFGGEGGTKPTALTLGELYASLQSAIWAEARTGAEVPLLRRNLQREHLHQLVRLLTRPAASPADAVALARDGARELLPQLQKAALRGALSRESRAHYADAAQTLQEALRATYIRAG